MLIRRFELTEEEQREAQRDAANEAMIAEVRGLGCRDHPVEEVFPSAIRIEGLENAALEGLIWKVKLELNAGADINARTPAFGSALHAAVVGGSLEVVKFLVEHGADPNANHCSGSTPLELATVNGRTAIAEFLRNLG
jgi:hypothetical protein